MTTLAATTAPPQTKPALQLIDLTKVFSGAADVPALDSVSLSLAAGSFTSVMGPSGSGKTTLLNCAAGLERPTRGEVRIRGAALPFGDEALLTKFRRIKVGFIFQSYNLIPYLTVAQNVDLPARFRGVRPDRARRSEVLERLGIADAARRPAGDLSGGQQQRVAIARALVSNPAVLFADEPTGALDMASGLQVLQLLREAVDDFGQTVVLVTHDANAASYADSTLFLADGRLVDHLRRPTSRQIADRMTRLTASSLVTVDGGAR